MRFSQVRSIFCPRRQPVWAFVCRIRGRHIFMEKSSTRMRPWKPRPVSSYRPKFRRSSPARWFCGPGMKKRPRRPRQSGISMKRSRKASPRPNRRCSFPCPITGPNIRRSTLKSKSIPTIPTSRFGITRSMPACSSACIAIRRTCPSRLSGAAPIVIPLPCAPRRVMKTPWCRSGMRRPTRS